MNKRLVLILSVLVAALLLSACEFSLAADITPPPGAQQVSAARTEPAVTSGPLYPLVPPDPANGRAIYAEKCAPCHGDSGNGDGPQAAQLPNPVTALASLDIARQSTPARWYTQVTQGNLERFMPPFRSLSDRERWDVVAYAFSLSLPAEVSSLGAELYQDNCARCHGAAGQGDGPDAASLGAAVPNLLEQAMVSQRTQTDFFQAITNGAAPAMPAFAGSLSEDERWTLAAYLRTLSFAATDQPLAGQPAAAESTPLPETSAITSTAPISSTAVAAVPDAAPGVGVISGSVVNASGGEAPVGSAVLLRGFDEMTEVYTQTTTVQENGMYSFENVEMPEGRVFMVTLDYNEAVYGSDIAMVETGTTSMDLPVTIYETTSDTSAISADRLHLFFEFTEDNRSVRVIQLFILSNTSNQTVVPPGEGQPSVTFNLPEGATGLEFQDGELGGRYIETEDGFGDSAAIRPGSGTHEILFAYELPYDRKLDLVQTMNLPVGAVVILLPEGSVKIKGDTLQDAGVRDVQGVQYHLYNGQGLAAGSQLNLTLSGAPATSTPGITLGSSTNLVVGLGAFGLALLAAGAWLFRRSRSATGEAEPVEEAALPEAHPEDTSESLMDAIIALDDLYQDGQLPEDAYQERRSELKARLEEVYKRG
jgi:mono/diheme cytochrome c family protein